MAERADNRAFTSAEISQAIVPALEQDCRSELTDGFLRDVCEVFREQESSLFKDDVGPRINALRSKAGSGIGHSILDNVARVSASEAKGLETLVKATAAALTDRAARGARQVEEHYLRKSSAPRANDVRARLEQGAADADLGALARQVLSITGPSPVRGGLKLRGLDDGVKLR